MTARGCCIKNCVSNTRNSLRLYRFPYNEKRRKLWYDCVKDHLRKNECDPKNLSICKLHFSVDCFYQDSIKVLKDGLEVELPRTLVTLNKTCVPTIFKDYPVDEIDKSSTSRTRKGRCSKYTFANSLESDSENHLEPLLHIKTEIIEMSSSETNCKELPEKKKRQPRKTARRSKKITNDIKMNNSEKLNHIENDNNSENTYKFPKFTFANSSNDDSQNLKESKISDNCQNLENETCPLSSSMDSIEKSNLEANKLQSNFDEFQNNNVSPTRKSKRLLSRTTSRKKIKKEVIEEKEEETNPTTVYPNFTFANSCTDNVKDSNGLFVQDKNDASNFLPKITSVVSLRPDNGIMSVINEEVPPINSTIVNLTSDTNHLPSTTLNPPELLKFNQNVAAILPTINNTVNLGPEANKLQPTFPVSNLSDYTFACRPVPNSPHCTEVLILKRLNSINPNQLKGTVPVTASSKLAFTNNFNGSGQNSPGILTFGGSNSLSTDQLKSVAGIPQFNFLKPINNDTQNSNGVLQSTIPVSSFPKFTFADNSVKNVKNSVGNLSVSGSNSTNVNNLESESPVNDCSEVYFANGNIVNNKNSTSKPLESSSSRVKQNQRELSPSSARRFNVVNEIMALNSSVSDGDSLISKDTSATVSNTTIPISSKGYSNAHLVREWNMRDVNKFPKYWGMNDSGEGVFFGYIGDNPGTITRSIFVKEDMTVEIRANNHIVDCPVIEKIGGLESLRFAMIQIVCMSLCEDSMTGQCKIGFYVSKHGTSIKRCKDCQLRFSRERCSEQRKVRNLRLQKEKRVKNERNLKARLNRAIKRIEAMQKAYEELSNTLILGE